MLNTYLRVLLARPLISIFIILLVAVGLISYLPSFRMDASADSLVVEGDPDLALAREVSERYGGASVVFVMFTPEQELFSEEQLGKLRRLNDEIQALSRVDSIQSIFSVPLFGVADVALTDIDGDNLLTLDSPGVDLQSAKEDLSNSQAYQDALISRDGNSANLVVNFVSNEEEQALLNQREALRAMERAGELDEAGRLELADVSAAYEQAKVQSAENLHQDIVAIRSIIAGYEDGANIVMGGVPMIADDLVSFVKSDLVNFGIALVLFIIIALTYLFRKVRYVLVPMLCCTIIALSVTGLLGLLDWPVTVISSNFISLLLIISISLNVHLMVRYRELQEADPEASHRELLETSLKNMFKPCAYTSLTTIVAFGSLVVSDIPPIIDFGWMMVAGIFLAFGFTFSLFPCVMLLLPKPSLQKRQAGVAGFTPLLARFTLKWGGSIIAASALLFVFCLVGMTRLKVENSFINYFDAETEIYQGMVELDERMGGTIPVDVLVTMSKPNPFADVEDPFADEAGVDEWAEEDEWADEWEDEWESEEGGSADDAYWFTSDKMQRIIEMHDYLDSIPETGKVLSLGTLLKIAYELNGGPLSSIELGVLYNRIPDVYKDSLLSPYVSPENDQARFSIRVRETDPDLVRNQLIQDLRNGMQDTFDLEPEQVQLSGMLVLYNNMLQSLFKSQILTLGLVLLIILGMFVVLFRSWKLALIGIIPNILAAAVVLGLMGWLGIPLDMMSITIAAISVGIGVDNTIHYIHRFKASFSGQDRDYRKTLVYSHGSIGQAMFYTGFTIIVGFSILVLSNFVPTIYFGLLTSLAMLVALGGSLTLLPQLLLLFKPLGRE